MNIKSRLGFISIAAALLLSMSSPVLAQISLGSAQSFGALAGSTVTNTGGTTVNGHVGVYDGTAITGFPPGQIVGGIQHSGNAVAQQAQSDLTVAFNNIGTTPCTVDLTGQNLGGLTLTPGVYCFSSSAQLTGALVLDGLGNPNALFLFKIGTTLTTASLSSVDIINAGSGCNNAYWRIGSSATIGTGTSFEGDILAQESITFTTGANSTGRALARVGAVTLDTNNINTCGPGVVCPIITVNPATLPNGTVGTAYNQILTAAGGTPNYSFGVSSGTLPTGLVLTPGTGAITGSPTTPGTFTFSITATDSAGCRGTRLYTMTIASPGCPAITLTPNILPPGVAGSQYVQQITANGGSGTYNFIIASGALPTGLVINPATGLISGVPTQTGLFSFRIRAADSSLPPCAGEAPYTITILAAGAGIPTLGSWMLLMFAAFLAIAGAFTLSRFTS